MSAHSKLPLLPGFMIYVSIFFMYQHFLTSLYINHLTNFSETEGKKPFKSMFSTFGWNKSVG